MVSQVQNGQKNKEKSEIMKKTIASTEESTNASDNASKESSSTFWKDLRRKILFDLQRHFKRKVDHDRLVSSLCKYFCKAIIINSYCNTYSFKPSNV